MEKGREEKDSGKERRVGKFSMEDGYFFLFIGKPYIYKFIQKVSK